MDAISAVKVQDVWKDLLTHDVVGIDEGQFVSSLLKYSSISL